MATDVNSGPGETGVRDDNARSTDRLEAFSDGVFAIAITLLVIEIRPPHLEPDEGPVVLIQELLGLWPAYLGYLISFLTIGVLWINHHNIFRYFARTDPVLVAINTLLLLCVGFIPFPTALLAEHLGHPGQQVAVFIYGGWFTLTSLVYNLLWRYPIRNRRLVAPEVPQASLDAITRRFLPGAPLYLLATLVALVSPEASVAIQLALAIFYLWPYSAGRSSQQSA